MLPPDREPDLPPDPVIEVYKRDVDRTLHATTLKLTVEERLRQLMRMSAAADALREAREQSRK